MGKRGPSPKPTALRILDGEKHKSRINTDEPQPRIGLPECPAETDPEVRVIWDYTLDQLAHMGLASPADRDALLVYCTAVATHRKACRLMATSSLLIKGLNGGLIRNPLVQVQRDAAGLIRGFAQEFGLTPSARSQINATAVAGRRDDDAERYFG